MTRSQEKIEGFKYRLAGELKTLTTRIEKLSKFLDSIIVCAASKFSVNGKELVIHGTRHYVPDMHAVINTFEDFRVPVNEISQGFITNRGRYVDRKEALKIAEKNDHVRHSIGYAPDELYSEIIY